MHRIYSLEQKQHNKESHRTKICESPCSAFFHFGVSSGSQGIPLPLALLNYSVQCQEKWCVTTHHIPHPIYSQLQRAIDNSLAEDIKTEQEVCELHLILGGGRGGKGEMRWPNNTSLSHRQLYNTISLLKKGLQPNTSLSHL